MKMSSKFALILFLSVLFLFQIIQPAYPQTFKIGQKYRGGIIFYIDSTGMHGLIAATSDQGQTFGKTGRPSFKSNLSKEKSDDATIAKRTCSYYTTTVKGITYHTWYLPSRRELQLLYAKKSIVGGFTNGFYWSSTWNERFGGFFLLDFSNGNNYSMGINCEGFIRPIQAF